MAPRPAEGGHGASPLSSSASPTVFGRPVESPTSCTSASADEEAQADLDAVVPREGDAVPEAGTSDTLSGAEATPLMRELRTINEKLDLLLSTGRQQRSESRRGLSLGLPAPPVWMTFVAAFLGTSSLAPLIWGFPSLRRLLLQEGALPFDDARAKELYLAMVFTMGASASQAGRLPFGMLADRAGPRPTVCLAACIVSAGAALMSFSSPSRPYYEWSYLLLGLGGGGVQVVCMGAASLAQRKALVSVSLSMSFQVGFIMVRVFELLQRATGVTRRGLFGGVAIYAGAFAVVGSACFQPWRPPAVRAQPSQTRPDDAKGEDIKKVLRSVLYWKQVFWFASLFMAGQFFFGTAALRLGPLTSTDVEPFGLDTLNVLLSPTILLLGPLMQRCRLELLFVVISAMSGLHNCLLFVPVTSPGWVRLQYAFFCITRGWLFGLCSAAVGITFGFRHYGTLVGIVFLAGGVSGALVRPLSMLRVGGSSSGSPFPLVDAVMVVLCFAWVLAYGVPLVLEVLAGGGRLLPPKPSGSSKAESLLVDADVEDTSVFTKVITRKVKRGCMDQYRIHLRELKDDAESFPGLIGQTVIEPPPGGGSSHTFVAILRFQGVASLVSWDNSEVLHGFYTKVNPLTDWSARVEVPEAAGRSIFVSMPEPAREGAVRARVGGVLLVWLLSGAASLGFDAAAEAASPSGVVLSGGWALQRSLTTLLSVGAALGLLLLACGPHSLPKLKRE